MINVLLSLGSNLQPTRHLRAALDELRQHFGELVVSPAYLTTAVGFDGPDFVNNAVALRTLMTLPALDRWLHALEDRHGRDRSGPRYADRTLDVDIVFYGQTIADGPGRLRIPRPELRHAFVLRPLVDIAPAFVDPLSGRTLAELWQAHPEHGLACSTVALEP